MTVELSVLAWSSVLLLVLILISANANLSAMGMAWGIGNREEASTASGWGARARRAYLNLLENLRVTPQSENTFTNSFREINYPAHAVVKNHFQTIIL